MNRESLVIVSDCDVEFLWKFPFRGSLIPNNWLKKCRLYKLSLRGSKARESLDELFFQNIYIVQSMCDRSHHQLTVLPKKRSIIGCWRHGGAIVLKGSEEGVTSRDKSKHLFVLNKPQTCCKRGLQL